MIPYLLLTLALAAAPETPTEAPAYGALSAHDAIETFANNPLDPALQLDLARSLATQPERVEESVEILAGLLKTKAVAKDAQRLLIDTLLAAPVRRAWTSLYGTAAAGAAPADAERLRAQLRAAEHLGAAPSVMQPLTPSGSDPRGAWAVAPNDVTLARQAAEAAIAEGDLVGALAPLDVVLNAWPADRIALGMHASASTAAGHPERTRTRLQAALPLAPDVRSRTALMNDLVAVIVVAGEQHKLDGAPDDALRDYLTAAALRPSSLDVLRGAAGLEWQLQHLEGAWLLYNRVLQLRPNDVDALRDYLTAAALRPSSLDVLRGAAGLEWQLQHLEGAWLLYNRVLQLRPNDVDALMGAVTVGLTLGHDEATQRLIRTAASNRASSKDPRTQALSLVQARAERAADARTAAREGDAAAAAAEFQKLIDSSPPEAVYFNGLADALSALGRKEEAAVAWQQAVRLDPSDAWASIGAANALLDLGRTEDARALLSVPPSEPPPGAGIERLRTLARAWRMDGDAARTAGKPELALTAYAAALDAYPETWACEGVASLYLASQQPEVAIAFYEEALRLTPNEPNAVEGRALALEALSRAREGVKALDALLATAPSALLRSTRDAMAIRAAVQDAMRLRESGDLAGAKALLTAAVGEGSVSGDLYAATAAVAVDAEEMDAAAAAIRKALTLEPANAWARKSALAVGRDCNCTTSLLPTLSAAVQSAPSPDATLDLDEAEMDAATQTGVDHYRRGRLVEAVDAMRKAEALAVTAEQFVRVGGGWLKLDRGGDAMRCFEIARTSESDNVDALIGRAGALAMRAHLAEAETRLSADVARIGDARLGLALARLQLLRGKSVSAARTLKETPDSYSLPAPASSARTVAALEIIPLPSGRNIDPASERGPTPPKRVDVSAEKAALAAEIRLQRSLRGSAGVAVVNRGGLPGWSGLTAVITPVVVGPTPAGPVRIDVEAVPVHLDDVDGTDDGLAASIGIATPEARLFGVSARAGVSPIGFEGGFYPVWSARLVTRLAPHLALGLQTDRLPRADSRTSWAGAVSPSTGQVFGRVSEIDGRTYLSWTPPQTDVGAALRVGYVEGIGVAPNPFGEAVVWAARAVSTPGVTIRAGVDGIASTYQEREDGFVPGQGGYFSPPAFLLAIARADVNIHGSSTAFCAGVGIGPRYLEGTSTGFGATGVAVNATAHAGVATRLSPMLELLIDGRGQVSSDGWHQVGALARLGWGVATTIPGAPALSTLAAPGLALPGESTTCTISP